MYEGEKDDEYLDLSHRALGVEGVLDVLRDVAEDVKLRHLNLSGNIDRAELDTPTALERFFKKLRRFLTANQTLTALDLAENSLFVHHPHATNAHNLVYERELCDILLDTAVTHVDVSGNMIAGPSGRELSGLVYFMQQWGSPRRRGKAFQCRSSGLSSQGLRAAVFLLGEQSSLTYLDLSDNLGGLDPSGNQSSDGVSALAAAITRSHRLKTLKLARNRLRDSDLVLLADAIQTMPNFQSLDVSGNQSRHYGCRALRIALISHGAKEISDNDRDHPTDRCDLVH